MKKFPLLAAGLLGLCFAAAPIEAQAGRNRNRIERDEIEASHATTVYDLVRGRRSAWLNREHAGGFGDRAHTALLVFVDGAQLENINELRQVSASNVERVEFLSGSQTEFRFGKQSPNGSIVVTLMGAQHRAPETPSQGG